MAGGRARLPGAGRRRGLLTALMAVVNVLLLACAVLLYGRYTAIYRERLLQENLGNIANLNRSAASKATVLIGSWHTKLEDVVQLAARRGGSRDWLLQLLEDGNSSADRQFQLIGPDYSGYLARRDNAGAFIPVDYGGNSYLALQAALDDREDRANTDVCFAPEFTDSETALKYFAVYRHLPLADGNGETGLYTLLLATRSRDVLAGFNDQSGFEGQSTVLIDAAGNYIVSNSDFKSANFFQYLYVYNDLTLDQRNSVRQELNARDQGELYYRDAAGRDCVFRYVKMTTNNWYCVTCVPIASFRTTGFPVNYAVYAVLALLLMLAVDMLWLQYMNRRLRVSMRREKEASEAKTDFLSRMSHDIRTPLNGIIGLTSLALEEVNPPRTKEYLDNIRVSGDFLLGLVNDILDMSKVESGKVDLQPEPYGAEDLCRYVEAVVVPLCREKGLAFRMSEPDGQPPVLLDRLRFNQVVFNLLSNAVKYTPSGGLVELYWTRTPLDGGRVSLELTVRDNGIGMSEDFQKRMFESFSQEHAQTANTGSGLGLTIVRSLVKLMHGQLRVQSKQGVGSTFVVTLEAAVSGQAAEAAQARPGAALAGRRVLVCEDNQINILFIRRLLEKWGVLSDAALNGSLGVAAFRDAAPGYYDAILMDVMMPELNGLDATRAIRGLPRADAVSIPIIAMTANAYDTDVRSCLDAGMDAHVGKPVDPQRLRQLLSELIAARAADHQPEEQA